MTYIHVCPLYHKYKITICENSALKASKWRTTTVCVYECDEKAHCVSTLRMETKCKKKKKK